MTKVTSKCVGGGVVVGGAFVGIMIHQNADSLWLSILGIFLGCLAMSAGAGIWKGKGPFSE